MMNLNATQWIAIYGAVVATAGISWQFYQYWVRGPKFSGQSGINMILIGNPMYDSEQKYVTFNVQNRGTESTLITGLCLLGYNTIIAFWLNRPTFTAVVVHDDSYYKLPGKLLMGDDWRSKCLQDEKIEQLTRSKIMCFALYHSFSSRPFRVRIRPIPFEAMR